MNRLTDLLRQSAVQYPEAPAVAWAQETGGGGFSYSRLHSAVLQGAARLRGAELRTGDKVLLFMEPRPEWALALFSILEAGLVVVPLPAETPPPVAVRIAVFAEAKAVILGAWTQSAALAMNGIRCFPVEELFHVEGAAVSSGGEATLTSNLPRTGTSALQEAAACDASPELAILAFTSQIDEAYALADRYRAAGVPVVLGGLHVSLLPDEAAHHADSVVLYGAESAWPRLVEDFQRGQLKPRYEGLRAGVFLPGNYAHPRFDLLRGRPYNRLTIQTSRGCPLNCEFCAASIRITSAFQQKPVDLVVAELRSALAVTDHPFIDLSKRRGFWRCRSRC